MATSTADARRDVARRWAIALGVVVALVHLVAIAASADELSAWTKPLLVLAILLATLLGARGPWRIARVLLVAGLVLSWLGDVLLGPSLLVGLLAFLAAHVAYVLAFSRVGEGAPSAWCLLLAPWYAGLLWLLAPDAGAMLVPLAVYGLALAALAIAAARVGGLATIGAVLFLVSDSVLGIRLFTEHLAGPVWSVVVMATYLAAQSCIAIAIARRA